MIKLVNNNMTLLIDEFGAEIKSFKIDEIEFMWNKKEYWSKTSPALFPFVGALLDNKYIFNEKNYFIETRHGFARDNKFKIVSIDNDEIKLMFESNEETLKIYPFNFKYYHIYKMTKNGFKLKFRVENLNNYDMYFSLGGHPAFLLDDDYNDNYYIQFEKEENCKRYEFEKGFIKDSVEYFENKNSKNIIDINDELFNMTDTLAFKNLNSECVTLKSKNTNKTVKITFKNFKYLAFWKIKNAPFICIEPWLGITDKLDTDYKLENKEGIIKLEKGKVFEEEIEFSFSI